MSATAATSARELPRRSARPETFPCRCWCSPRSPSCLQLGLISFGLWHDRNLVAEAGPETDCLVGRRRPSGSRVRSSSNGPQLGLDLPLLLAAGSSSDLRLGEHFPSSATRMCVSSAARYRYSAPCTTEPGCSERDPVRSGLRIRSWRGWRLAKRGPRGHACACRRLPHQLRAGRDGEGPPRACFSLARPRRT